jgi:hypothetical protein
MKKAKKVLWMMVVLIVLVLTGYIYFHFYYTYSEGYRAGVLQKLSYKGNIFKTFEGELILSSIESNRNAAIASEKFFFSVPGKEVADKMAKLEGQTVTLHYRETHGTLIWRGDSKYLVDSVLINH